MKKRDTIVRYTAPERINHWVTAFCFILAAVSGMGFLFPSFNWLMHIMGTPQLARIVHPFVVDGRRVWLGCWYGVHYGGWRFLIHGMFYGH